MAEKATVHYQVVIGGDKLAREVIVKAEKEIAVQYSGGADDLVGIHGDDKKVYIHRACLVAVVIDKTD